MNSFIFFLIHFQLQFCGIWSSISDESSVIPTPVKDVNTAEFLQTHSSYNKYTTTVRKHNSTTLVYVTPWNKHGYKISEIFASKFDLISPVWFQIMNKKKSYTITGVPDVDKVWLDRVRVVNPDVRIVPRIAFTDWTDQDFVETLTDTSNRAMCVSSILRILKNFKFDGAVIEIWSQFSGLSLSELVVFLKQLFTEMQNERLLSVLVIPPPVYRENFEGRFNQRYFDQLFDAVDFFSLMTYDYSNPMKIGPNSPISWVADCIRRLVNDASTNVETKRAKILTGFNFYGMDYVPSRYSGEPILGNQLVELVTKFKPDFKWHEEWAEHLIDYTDGAGEKHKVFYPSLFSIFRRIFLTEELGTGISVWEIGQGLDSFYTLF